MKWKETSVSLTKRSRQLFYRIGTSKELNQIIEKWMPHLWQVLPEKAKQGINYQRPTQEGETFHITPVKFTHKNHLDLGYLRLASRFSASLILAIILDLHFGYGKSKVDRVEKTLPKEKVDFSFRIDDVLESKTHFWFKTGAMPSLQIRLRPG